MTIIDELGAAPAPRAAGAWSIAITVLLGLLLAVLFARSAHIAIGVPPSFDGAMNLQVAASISQGEGYRRNYASREAFPHEIQTGAPYILPAAAVFKLFNVGIPQAEIINLAYLALLLWMVYLLVSPFCGRSLGLFAACTAIAIPGIHRYGLYGYGEVPGLAWVFAATIVYFGGRGMWWRGLLGGVLLALAVYTKTVMLIGAGAVGLCALLEIAVAWRDRAGELRVRFTAFLTGGLLVVTAMEVWRMLALGGIRAWRDWWGTEAGSIFMQAGVKPGYSDNAVSLLNKLQVHFSLLSHDYRMSLVLTGLWLALVFSAFVYVLFQTFRQRRERWATLVILLMAVVYLVWWLLVTPTAKAWHRRILDGMIGADVGVVMVVAACLAKRPREWWKNTRSVLLVFAGLLALVLPAMWLVESGYTLLASKASEKTCIRHMASSDDCAQFHPDASVSSLKRLVRKVRALPADAYVFGIGWYSAPRVGLLAQRHFLDFNDIPVSTLQPSRPVYFVQGSITPPPILKRIRTLYEVTRTPNYANALIRAVSMTPKSIVAGEAQVRRRVKGTDNYAYLHGFEGLQANHGRWLTDDNQVLLQPKPGDSFELVAYVLAADRYESHRTPNIIVSFDGCVAPPQGTRPNSVNHLVFAIPAHCDIVRGRPVNVRIEVDGLVDAPIWLEARSISVVAMSFGFVGEGAEDIRANGGARG